MSVKLRKAKPEDIPQLAAMSLGLSEAGGSAVMPLAKHKERVRREFETHVTKLILRDNAVVGYLVYLCQEDPEDKTIVLQIHRLFVKPAYRRKGFGREAVQTLLGAYPRRTHVFLAVKPGNKPALAFYKSLDFSTALLTMKRVL